MVTVFSNGSVQVDAPQTVDGTIYARIKHDTKNRNNGLTIWPETVPMQNVSSGTGKGVTIPYLDVWETFTRSLNSTASARWLFAIGTMLFNIKYTDTPLAESIANGGNVVKILETANGHGRIEHFRNTGIPPQGVTFLTHPWLIEKVVCVHRNTLQILNPSNGKDVYFPLLSRSAFDLWLPLEKLEIFPVLPIDVTILAGGLPIVDTPGFGGIVIGYVYSGETETIYEYRPQGCDVWGRISDGWICLSKNRTFYTSWQMGTQPPIPPV